MLDTSETVFFISCLLDSFKHKILKVTKGCKRKKKLCLNYFLLYNLRLFKIILSKPKYL